MPFASTCAAAHIGRGRVNDPKWLYIPEAVELCFARTIKLHKKSRLSQRLSCFGRCWHRLYIRLSAKLVRWPQLIANNNAMNLTS